MKHLLFSLKREGIFRELMEAILCPKHDDSPLVKEKYKLVFFYHLNFVRAKKYGRFMFFC